MNETNTETTESVVAEIGRLHGELGGFARRSLQTAIRIGELLSESRSQIPHGHWIPWLQANVPFTRRTAQRYLELFENRGRLKWDTVSHLKDAYELLAEPEKPMMTREEATASVAKLQEHLHAIIERISLIITIRDGCGWRFKFPTFEDWLLSVGSNLKQFEREIDFYDAFVPGSSDWVEKLSALSDNNVSQPH